MIEKIFILCLIASAQIVLAAEPNPCGNRSGPHFAKNPRGCSWYFVCDDTNIIVRENRCENGLHFSYHNQMCDYRDRVKCDLDDRWTNATCPDEKGINVIPNPITCLKYTVCFEGFQNDRTCPQGKHFSYFENKCVDPFYADCSLDYNLCKPSRESGVPVFVANPRDCGSYFVCVGETAVVATCPPNLHFNNATGWCQSIEEAKCTPEIPADTPRIPDKVFIDCGEEYGNIPHPDACEFYFFCVENRSYLQICGEGLIFDINTRRCQYGDKAQCVLDTVTTPSTTTEGGSGDGDDDTFSIFESVFAEAPENPENFSPEEEGFIRLSEK